MKAKLSIDHRGKFYQDFYRIIVQNEQYDDWRHVLSKVDAGENHLALLSTAADGNFMQSINMSMNEFSFDFTERRLETLGQQVSVLIALMFTLVLSLISYHFIAALAILHLCHERN
ncbi:unnamed protein product [Gongylonema pulchrum]|uniref:GOLD domain-containing protein n=1 Tax=Gongylonema pulchrum TaxID=637853 RepID=A0A183F0T1_9BILA|nr:unnamed protein product [Gongylonema pulchrum]